MKYKLLIPSIDGYSAIPAPECMEVKAFRALLDRAEDISDGVRELSYVYHMVDVRSPYQRYPQEERHDKVVQFIMPDGWEPDKLVLAAMSVYRELSVGPIAGLLEGSYESIHKLERVLKKVEYDPQDKDILKKGRELMSMIGDLGERVKGLNVLKEQAEMEMENDAGRVRGDITIDPEWHG